MNRRRRSTAPHRLVHHVVAMVLVGITAAWAFGPVLLAEARRAITLVQVSHDPLGGGGFEHHSEVEPDVVSHGDTVLAAFQVGRSATGGAEAIGVAVSTDDARTWSDQVLRGSAKATGGRYQRASDPSARLRRRRGWMARRVPWYLAHRAIPDPDPVRDPGRPLETDCRVVRQARRGRSCSRWGPVRQAVGRL